MLSLLQVIVSQFVTLAGSGRPRMAGRSASGPNELLATISPSQPHTIPPRLSGFRKRDHLSRRDVEGNWCCSLSPACWCRSSSVELTASSAFSRSGGGEPDGTDGTSTPSSWP